MAEVLLVDDRAATAQMYEEWLQRMHHNVRVITDPSTVTAAVVRDHAPNLAVIDLSYANYDISGLDVLLLIYRTTPDCRLTILTNGDPAVGETLRIAWEALPIVCALSKGALYPTFELAIRNSLSGTVYIDTDLQAWLPTQRNSARSIDRFGDIMAHAGHARLLLSLIEHPEQPSQAEVAKYNGWMVTTVRNYTIHITQMLEILGFQQMDYAQLHAFVRAARPIIDEAARRVLETSGDTK